MIAIVLRKGLMITHSISFQVSKKKVNSPALYTHIKISTYGVRLWSHMMASSARSKQSHRLVSGSQGFQIPECQEISKSYW